MENLANMECALIKERTLVGLDEARKRKIGGRPKSMQNDQKSDVSIMKKKRSNLFLQNAVFQLEHVINISIYLKRNRAIMHLIPKTNSCVGTVRFILYLFSHRILSNFRWKSLPKLYNKTELKISEI